MSKLIQNTVILEGITHLEDLPLEKFIDAVETMKNKVITEKLDGANLWFGVDDKGFFTSREGKRKGKARFYSVKDYPLVAAYNGFRAAHLALENVKSSITSILSNGDMIEMEVIFGRQPNTVTYGANNLNFIVMLRGINTDQKKVDALASKLKGKKVNVTSTVVSSDDGNELNFTDESLAWEFTEVHPLDVSQINSSDATAKLGELKQYLAKKNETFSELTNKEVAEVKLGSVDKTDREDMKKERERVLSQILSQYKLPIKELLLNDYVRKIKPTLQSDNVGNDEDIGVEGVVIRDPNTDDQVKIVDKDVFTAMNTFNNFIRSVAAGSVRTDNQDAPLEMRGGAYGQGKIRIAALLGIKELAVGSTAKKILSKFKGDSPQATCEKLASSLNIQDFNSVKTKISAILSNAAEDVSDILEKFKAEAKTYKLKLKTGKEIGLSQEVIKRNLTAFAETTRDIHEVRKAVRSANDPTELVNALYGRTIQSLFMGNENVKEAFSLLKKINEDGEGVDAGATPAAEPQMALTTKSSAIEANPKKLLRGSTLISRRKRKFIKRAQFVKPVTEGMSLLQLVEFAADNATDVDDTVSAQNDIEFNQLRNNVSVGSTGNGVSPNDVNAYLNKAHELNDEVDTVTFGLEMDDGAIVKVYVNADEADNFEAALSKMLGEFDDVEEAINKLADNFDIVDVEWPHGSEQAQQMDIANQETDVPDAPSDGADQISTRTDPAPEVNPVIDIGNVGSTTDDEDVPSDNSDETSDDDTTVGSVVDDEDQDDDLEVPTDQDQDMGDDEVDDVSTDDTSTDDGTSADEMTIDNSTFHDADEDESDESESSDTDADVDATQSDETTDTDTSSEEDDEVVGGEVAADDEEDDTSDEEENKPKKKAKDKPTTQESNMTYGQAFKEKLLAEKAKPKNKDDEEVKDVNPALPAAVKKLLTAFPSRGDKAMVTLLYAMGVPLDAMALKKAELRTSVETAGQQYLKDSQFRLWTGRLTDELLAAGAVTEAALEDELSNKLQRMIIEVMQKVGLPDSVERLARATLRSNIKAKAKLVMTNAKLRQYLKIVAEMLGIDAVTGMVKEDEDKSKEVEAYGTKGMKSTQWRKTFKNQAEFEKWMEKNGDDVTLLGVSVAEAAPSLANPGVTDDQTGNEWVDEIFKLVSALGVPADNLNYRRKQVEMAVRKRRMSVSNSATVLRNIKKLNLIVGNNSKE